MKGLINDLVETAKLEALYELETVPRSPLRSHSFHAICVLQLFLTTVKGKTNIDCSPPPEKQGATQGTGQDLWGAAGGAGSLVGGRSSRQGFLLEVRARPSAPALPSVRFG